MGVNINWRSIEEHGMPTDSNVGYLVSDGENVEYSDIDISYYSNWNPKTGKDEYPAKIKSIVWIGGSVFSTYDESPGTEFDFNVTHWCPASEINRPKKNN